MSEEQSDFPGPLNVDTDKLEVTYNPSMPESSFSPLSSGSNSSQALLMLSRTDDETPSKPTLRAAQNRHLDTGVCLESHSRMSKRIACCLCGVLLFAFGVYGGIFYYIFSSSSSYPITTYAPRAPIAPMAPAAPASPMEPPRPIGPVDPICHPSNIPGTFYNQRGTLLPALRQCSPFQRRSDDAIGESDGGWSVGQRESVKIACGRSIGRITRISEDAYKKYSIEYALALARGTNGKCRVLLFALVFGEFKSVILEVANHTAGRENRVTTEREGTLRDSGTQRKEPKKKSLLKVDSSPLDVDSSPAKYENYTPTGSFDERETAPTMRPREVSIALTLQLDAHQPGGSIDDAMSSWLMDNGGISNKYCNDNRSMDV
ncbi:hypothetical protein PRIPAC_85534 [Pristionchus pacificus]|uniref:Uncharacterized protein n=1 Tax=Pristionchus pacificus TaxID=54126 RepID=A0A2A6BMZ2_PRIPA|nr:hypothetical protein PRIPAC_85534 [Pristionchus pacificus]|eukprot:PDM67332.1 hypothetical protein PRIPAC_48749 [Pristionchus pacificus]